MIEKGDYIVDGNPAPHDILAIKGVEELAAYLVNEIQEVYRLQGVLINDKHIEVIVRQMLQKVEIDRCRARPSLIQGEQLDKIELRRDQRQAEGRGQEAGHGAPGAARHHQGVAADPLVHLGGLVPGDHPRAHRGGGQRQARHARRPQGERHRRPADPGRHRRDHELGCARSRPSATASSSRSARRSRPRRPPSSSSRRRFRRRSDRAGRRRPPNAIERPPRGAALCLHRLARPRPCDLSRCLRVSRKSRRLRDARCAAGAATCCVAAMPQDEPFAARLCRCRIARR